MKVSITKDGNKCKIQCETATLDIIRHYFSEPSKGAAIAFHKGFKHVPFFNCPITQTGTFNAGLLNELILYLVTIGIDVDISKINTFTPIPPKCKTQLTKTLRDYQEDVLTECNNTDRGVVIAGTGAGKTLIIAKLLQECMDVDNNFKAVVIVPDIGLVQQTYDDFKSYGCTFTSAKWSGKNEIEDPSSVNVIICNLQIIQARSDFFKKISTTDVIIVDEVHRVTSKGELKDILNKCNSKRMYGFTGTLPESLFERWNIVGVVGPVIYRKDSNELREEKFLSDIKVTRINVDYTDISNGSMVIENYKHEKKFLAVNQGRNNLIKDICSKHTTNVLILVNTIEHGENLLDTLKQLPGKHVVFVRGSVAVSDRKILISQMEKSDDIVCIAMSKIFSTGINITNIHNIIFADAGKSFIRIVQSIGRGLRLHKDKKILNVVDISDILEYSIQHAEERERIYKVEKIPYINVNITI